jgi:hypothetical protein
VYFSRLFFFQARPSSSFCVSFFAAMRFIKRSHVDEGNSRTGLIPVECKICKLPLGNCLMFVATTPPGGCLRRVFMENGFGAGRICCRDEGLSRAKTVVSLAKWIGRSDVNVTSKSSNHMLRIWNEAIGPFTFLKRAEEEAVTSLLAARIHVCRKIEVSVGEDNRQFPMEWRGPYISILATSKSPMPPFLDTSTGTRSISILGTVTMKLSDEGPLIEKKDCVVLSFPSCGAVHGEACRIFGRVYSPISTACNKRNRHVTTLKGSTVEVCFLSMDPRKYEGDLDGEKSPSIASFRISLSSKTRVCQDSMLDRRGNDVSAISKTTSYRP